MPIRQLYETVAEELAKGTSKQEVVRTLVKQGHGEYDAIQFVDHVDTALSQYRQSPEGRRIMAGKYARHMLFGALWAIGGTIVTLWTYNAAGPGETYVIAWGAIGFGAIDFLWGFFNWLRYTQ
jgi:hypothetical protein